MLIWTLAVLACSPGPQRWGTVPPASETGWRFDPVALEGYPPFVTDLAFEDDELWVADKSGGVLLYDSDQQRVGGFRLDIHDKADCGLISIALDPDFADNGFLYFGACVDPSRSGVFRVTVAPDRTSATDLVEILVVGDPTVDNNIHNVGWIGFDHSGALLALFGEKGRAENALDLGSVLGTVVRIDPSRVAGEPGFTVPADNPFVATSTVNAATWALGVRSPWTGAVDALGRVWVGDVGSTTEGVEEIDLVQAGDDLGWPDFEGPCDDCQGTVEPVITWPHDVLVDHRYYSEDPYTVPTILRVVFVAPGQLGPVDPYGGELTDRLLFGDACMGFVRKLAVDDQGTVVEDEPLAHLPGIMAWVEGWGGFQYASSVMDCGSELETLQPAQLYKLVVR